MMLGPSERERVEKSDHAATREVRDRVSSCRQAKNIHTPRRRGEREKIRLDEKR